MVAVIQHFFRRKVAQQLLNIVVCAFASKEFTGRNIQKADATRGLSKVHGSQEIVFFVVQHRVGHGYSRRNEFGYASFHHLIHLGKPLLSLNLLTLFLRIFQLIADGNTLSCTNEFRQIGV